MSSIFFRPYVSVMEPVDAVVREAVLHSFASFAPNAAPFPPAAWEVEGEPVPQHLLLSAQAALGEALSAAYSGPGPHPRFLRRVRCRRRLRRRARPNRMAAAVLRNDDARPDGPEVLLPLADDVLVHFVNRIHSCDR